jgi:hypothetical protein
VPGNWHPYRDQPCPRVGRKESMMKCRAFHPGGRVCFFALVAMLLLTLALGLLVAPLAAESQPPGKVYRIGFLSTNPPPAHLWEALLEGLRERGYHTKGGTSSSSTGSRKATRSASRSSPPSWSSSRSISSS